VTCPASIDHQCRRRHRDEPRRHRQRFCGADECTGRTKSQCAAHRRWPGPDPHRERFRRSAGSSRTKLRAVPLRAPVGKLAS
jgi:hypothetical protein